ncbi:DUF1828 domain-containing protein [Amedibacillus dolichus]|uniref:DUF1828 domain-containing protein n=1 Tax=Amedibacillus dolichus DSM 3991 TaxID=428127 RepID=A8RC44_9FIRM|nr:DUF1828 domain-containing protein [Amedibacillus dolichus]EDP11344.1 hypothetical protein EUBDOL_01264 [Amedibacillus dolichus DSM 3991]
MIDSLIQNYYDFIKSNIQVKEIHGYHEITTPLLDHSNDFIQVYVSIDNDDITITDDSYTISNLKACGLNFSDKRNKVVAGVCAQFGVKVENEEIFVKTDKNNFGLKLDSLLQCIVKIDDLCYVSRESVASFFDEDVKQYFEKNNLYFTENISLMGQSGYQFKIDLSFQRTKDNPTRWVNIINKASKSNCMITSFGWLDTVSQRNHTEKMYVIINDSNPIDKGVLEGFRNYDITPILWKDIETKISLFSN